ncbi:MAG: hypothetical protein IKP26_10100 [Clostridia bacterium]|nr:hypothetical protein [Clostridia bacterium]MBR6428353.1 hypothetical protein [Clostridia bacterium]
MSKDNVVQFPGQNKVKEDNALEGLSLSVEKIPASKIDLHSPMFERVDREYLEGAFDVALQPAISDLLNGTLDYSGVTLYTVTLDGNPVSPNDLAMKTNGSLFATIRGEDGRFVRVPDLDPVNKQFLNPVQFKKIRLIWKIMAVATRQKYLNAINNNLSCISENVSYIKMLFLEEQKNKLLSAIYQLEEFKDRKESLAGDTAVKTQILEIERIAKETNLNYESLLNIEIERYLGKTKSNKEGRTREENIKNELVRNLRFYELSQQVYVVAELLRIYLFEGFAYNELEILKKKAGEKQKEIIEKEDLVRNALVKEKLQKTYVYKMGNPSKRFKKASKFSPGFILHFPGGLKIEFDTFNKKFKTPEKIEKKKNELLEEANDLLAEIGDFEPLIENIEKLQDLYNTPLKIVQNQDEYYLVLDEKALGD